MQARPCKNLALNSSYWNTYASGLGELMSSYPPSWNTPIAEIKGAILKEGCGAVYKRGRFALWYEMCSVTPALWLKPFAYACLAERTSPCG